MSNSWSQGYFTDAGYTYGYYREINPVFQRFALLLRGFAVPVRGAGAAHCELGFGQGVSLNIHAAANPGHYIGTDFNPAHAAHARQLAQAADSGALLLDDSFEQLLGRGDLPLFDSISLHGIWTWVSRDNHRTIVEFARRQLKPGGVLYVSYNCFPGWAPAYPLRQLFALHDRFGIAPHETNARVQAALQFSEALLAAKPNYLRLAPHLTERLENIAKQNPQYLAHEYFNREWNCMYFTDVVDALEPAKLEWACTAVPLDTVDALNLEAQAQGFLKNIQHPLLREQARDYFVNQQFRKDLFLRGAIRLSPAQQREELLSTRFVLMRPAGDVSMKVTGALGEAALQEAIYQPLVQALAADAGAPKPLRKLAGQLPQMGWPQLLQALTVLVGMEAAAPCQPEDAERSVRVRCRALNRHLCDRSLFSGEVVNLASPVTGGGVVVPRFQQLFLLARELGHKRPQEWAQYAWQALAVQGQRIIKEGRPLETEEDNLAELTAQAQAFASGQLPVLKALQVVG
ncbi:class I SAM-dependent methyltransferase [Melaminivora sp.]|uniref:class I SAM-dependent methyltransferase n=1 Tax=Melaminivora sp. TaxID=1933032 RepID=UPI0028ABD8F2|nr:class I SAM-dependent methyltransferase [Melaminivora sp.]